MYARSSEVDPFLTEMVTPTLDSADVNFLVLFVPQYYHHTQVSVEPRSCRVECQAVLSLVWSTLLYRCANHFPRALISDLPEPTFQTSTKMAEIENTEPVVEEESDDEMVINASALLGLPDHQDEASIGREGEIKPEGAANAADGQATTPIMNASASEPVLGGTQTQSLVSFSTDTDSVPSEGDATQRRRNQRKSMSKRSLTLGGRQKSEVMDTSNLIAHLERNFPNILMLVSRSLDTLSEAFSMNKSKANQTRAIKLAQQLTFHLSEVNTVITKITNMCDGKTKVATESLKPDTVEEALGTSKHTLSVLLPKFNKMLKVTKEPGAIERIEDGLLEHIDEAMSDAAEQMDNLGNWLKESGFGEAAGAVMMAMRWKSKAFGGGKRRTGFGSIRIAPGGAVEGGSPGSSIQGDNKIVADALKDARAEVQSAMNALPELDAETEK